MQIARLFKITFFLFIILALMFAVLLMSITFSLPRLPDSLPDIGLSDPTEIYSDRGDLITVLSDRKPVKLSQISPHFLSAIIAVEDEGFYKHHGINKKGLIRMLFMNIRSGRIVGGGSSITQQLAKNLFFSFEQTWTRKIREALVAIQMEQRYTKNEILESYCNQIYFGANAYGIEQASQTYLGKHADELSLAEAAFLANLPNWPGYYNPYQNYDVAKERQKIVLSRMVDAKFISAAQMESAIKEPIQLKRLNLLFGKANYFVEYVKQQIEKNYSRDVLYYGGLKIHTTLDTRMQSIAQNVIKKRLAELDKDLGYDDYELAPTDAKRKYLQAALVAIDPTNGKVKALVGGRDFAVSPYNRAIANNRQPGSSFKPFTYLAAIDGGQFTPASIVVDSAVLIENRPQNYEPENWDNKYFGPITLKSALTHSRNIVAAKLINIVRPETVVGYANKMGIKSKLNPVLSLALGTSGVSPLEMATAYGTFANGGIARDNQIIKYVEDSHGNTLREYISQGERVVDPQSIYLVVDMMKNVVNEGTGRRVRWMGFDRPCAGKTGTTNDAVDLWFVGFTPQLVTAVWVGFDDPKPVIEKNGAEMSSGKAGVSIWTMFMKEALDGEPYRKFNIPPGILFVDVDPKTGEIVSNNYPGAQQVAIKADTQLPVKR